MYVTSSTRKHRCVSDGIGVNQVPVHFGWDHCVEHDPEPHTFMTEVSLNFKNFANRIHSMLDHIVVIVRTAQN